MSINTNYETGIFKNSYDWKKYDISENGNKNSNSKLETLADLRNSKDESYKASDIARLMEKYDPEKYATYKEIEKAPNGETNIGGIQYLNKWVNCVKAGFVKENETVSKTTDISSRNEEKLSSKAQEYLKNLRKKYSDYDFMIGNSADDIKSLSKTGSKEFSVIFSTAEIERMANDEKYAEEKMQAVEGAVKMCKRICEENGYVSAYGENSGENGTINKIGVVVDDNGKMKLFAELEKSSAKQKERLEKSRAKHAEEKKAAEKKKKNPYEKDDKESVKRTTIEADSEEELLEKLKELRWDKVKDSHSGDRFNFLA